MEAISPENADKILQKNLSNIIKKNLEGRPLSQFEISLIKHYRKEDLLPPAPHQVDWRSVAFDYITGLSRSDVMKKYRITPHQFDYRCNRMGWHDRRLEMEDAKRAVVEEQRRSVIEKYRDEVKEFLKMEYEECIEAIQKSQESIRLADPSDTLSVKQAIEARLKAHEFGRKSLNIDEKVTVNHTGEVKTTGFLESLQAIKSIVESKQFDPKTIDIEAVSQEEIEKE